MGLDMYLSRKFYVQNWEHMTEAEKHTITILKGGEPSPIPVDRICYIETEELYWRKANAIHKWFVDNVQEGKDDCGTYYVSQEKLQELLNRVNRVLAGSKLVPGPGINGYSIELDESGDVLPIPNAQRGQVVQGTKLAEELLPTAAGFFFGGTDYDQWYHDNLTHTRDALAALLAEEGTGGVFYYHSSW